MILFVSNVKLIWQMGNSDQTDAVDSHLDIVEDDVIVELDSVPSAIVLVRSQRDKLIPESNLNK